MRRPAWLVVLAFVVQMICFTSSAQAARGPGNSWTQIDNHDWPGASSDPSCSPCVRWPNYFYSGTWEYWMNAPMFFHTDAVSAMKEWSGQPYRSPMFSEGSRGCGGDVCVTVKALAPYWCARTAVTYNSARYITRAVVYLNTQGYGYSDGPARNGGCDLRDTYHHEFGHVFSEGHSSVRTDLMWTGNNDVEHVDADSQAELRAVYGTFSTGCPCPSIAAAKTKLLQEAAALDGVVTNRQGRPSAA